MTDRCQFVIECGRFWEYVVIALMCSLELWYWEWISLLFSHVVSANTEHVKMSTSSTVSSAESAAAANITHLVGAGFMQSLSWREGAWWRSFELLNIAHIPIKKILLCTHMCSEAQTCSKASTNINVIWCFSNETLHGQCFQTFLVLVYILVICFTWASIYCLSLFPKLSSILNTP